MKTTKKHAYWTTGISVILIAGAIFQIMGYHLHQPEVLLVDSTRKLAFLCRAANDQSYYQHGTRIQYILHALRSGWSIGAPDSGGFIVTEVIAIIDVDKALQMERKEMEKRRINKVNIDWSIGLRWAEYGEVYFLNPQFRGRVIRLKDDMVSSDIISSLAEMTRLEPDIIRSLAHPCTFVLHSEEWENGIGKPFNHIVINNGYLFYHTL